MKLRFEVSGKEDIDCIFNLNKELIDKYENIQIIEYERVLQWVYRKISRHIKEYTSVFYENKKAGYFRFYYVDGKMELDDLYIFTQFQNRGIGSAILMKCCSETVLPIFLYVFNNNIRAKKLYIRFGFKEVEKISDSRCIMQRGV